MATKFMNGIDVQSQKVINVASPTTGTDAANKAYVDNTAAGINIKTSVAAATTANITTTAPQTIDGVAVIAGNRVLVKNQTTASQNGIWIVAAGAWTLAPDSITGELNNGALVTVEAGTVNAAKSFILTTVDPITVGTTALVWSPFSAGTSYTAGVGLALTGSSFAVVPGAGIIADGTSTRVDPAAVTSAKKFAINVPSGSTTATITHNLGTLDLGVSVYEISSGNLVMPDIQVTTTNTVTLTFATAPTTGQYRAVVDG